MIHPLSSKVTHWYGTEVEGALSGLRTVFIAAPPADLDEALVGVDAAFVCEWCRPSIEWIDALARRVTTTVACYPHEVTMLKRGAPTACLMVRADMHASWVLELEDEDQVTIGVPFNLRTWRVCDGVRTAPEQYEEDHP